MLEGTETAAPRNCEVKPVDLSLRERLCGTVQVAKAFAFRHAI